MATDQHERARAVLEPAVYHYFAGSADEQLTRNDTSVRGSACACGRGSCGTCGGRQLDTTVDPPMALAEVAVPAVDATEVYVDGGDTPGHRPGQALVLVGPRRLRRTTHHIIWGLAADDADGVGAVLDDLRTELVRAMRLCGTPTLADITADLVVGP